MPNNQTVNPVDQGFLNVTAAPNPALWDPGLNVDTAGLSVSPSTAPTSLSLDSVTQPPPARGLTNLSQRDLAGLPGGQGSQVLPARGLTSRDGHERKRSRLSSESTPLDSVDYWIDFDKDDTTLPSIPEGAETESKTVGGSTKPQMDNR